MRLPRFVPATVLCGVAIVAAACISRGGSIDVRQGSQPHAVDFVYTPPATARDVPIDVIQVAGGVSAHGRGMQNYIWYVAQTNGAAPRGPVVIHFGTVPTGMAEAAPARSLLPGRYSVTVRANHVVAITEFRITASGQVESLGPAT